MDACLRASHAKLVLAGNVLTSSILTRREGPTGRAFQGSLHVETIFHEAVFARESALTECLWTTFRIRLGNGVPIFHVDFHSRYKVPSAESVAVWRIHNLPLDGDVMTNLYANAFLIALLLQASGIPGSSSSTPTKEEAITALKQKAESGDPKAQVDLGMRYEMGEGLPVDRTEAMRLFHEAAKKGDPAGEYRLGEMYFVDAGLYGLTPTYFPPPPVLEDKRQPVLEAYAKALKWLRKAADQKEARAQYLLAQMYRFGTGVAPDEAEAGKWLRKAADSGLADAQFEVGQMYENGQGVPRKVAEAIRWYRKAAGKEHAFAMDALAILFATSTDPKIRNQKEAVYLAERAAELAPVNAACLDTLASIYFDAGQPDNALEAEQRALELRPFNETYQQAVQKYLAALAARQSDVRSTSPVH